MSKDDESVVLPKAVRDQISQADEIYKAVYEPDDPENPENQDPDNAQDTAQKPDETPAHETETAQQPDPAPQPDPEPEDDHKYKVLKGKYDKEVPRLHRQLRDATQTINAMTAKINKLEGEIAGLKAAPAPEPANPLTQSEIDQFGPDLIDIIRRVAKSETGVALDEQLRPIKATVEQVQETVANPSEDGTVDVERMLTDLAEAVPDWEKQNTNPKFLDWLDEKDPFSGKVRTELMAEAWNEGDSERVINLFQGFQKENAVVNPDDEPSTETPENDPPAEETENPEQPLDELVAPGTPKTGSTGAQNESGKRIWTQKEIQEFYAYKNEFIKKNPERELPENVILQERDIFAAQGEGRIRN